MKYQQARFSVGGYTDKGRAEHERIFGKPKPKGTRKAKRKRGTPGRR